MEVLSKKLPSVTDARDKMLILILFLIFRSTLLHMMTSPTLLLAAMMYIST